MTRIYKRARHAAVPALAALLVLAACDKPTSPPAPASSDQTKTAANGPAGTAADETTELVAARTAHSASARANLQAASGSDVTGTLTLRQDGDYLRIEGEIRGLKPGVHGLHVHEVGDCSAPDASSAGGHYAPRGMQHGAPTQADELRHAGDLGNIVAAADGTASVDVVDASLTLEGPATIIGRAVVVHADPDDLSSQPSGNAGARVGCGVIEAADSPGG